MPDLDPAPSPGGPSKQLGSQRIRAGVLCLLLALGAIGGVYSRYRSSNAYQLKILLRPTSKIMDRDRALQTLLNRSTPEELADLIEGIEDPGKRGAYASLVVATKDPKLAPYLLTYVTKERPPVSSEEAEAATSHLEALRGFGDQVAVDLLFPAYDDSDNSFFVRKAIYEVLIQLPRDLLTSKVLALESPERRGAFPEVLAATGDPGHVSAIMAWATSDGNWTRAAKAVLALEPKQAAALLVGAYVSGAKLPRRVLLETFTAKQLAPEVAKRPQLHGEFPQAVAAHGDPALAPALFAPVRAGRVLPGNRQWAEYTDALVALGAGVLPEARSLLDSEKHVEGRFALEVLFRIAPNEGLTRVNGILSDYQKVLIKNWSQIRLRERMDPWKGRFNNEDRAFYRWREQLRPVATLESIRHVKGQQADFCFLTGLSSLDPGVARLCAKALDKRLTVNQLVDVLFRFIASKGSFGESEANVYHGLLNAKGAAAVPRVIANLTRLLKAAGGRPEKVFFLYKILGIRFLENHGTSAALPTIDRYARDASSYVYETTRTHSAGGSRPETERSSKTIRFAREWARARSAVRSSGR